MATGYVGEDDFFVKSLPNDNNSNEYYLWFYSIRNDKPRNSFSVVVFPQDTDISVSFYLDSNGINPSEYLEV